MMTDDRGVLFIVSSPSGGGKTTLVRRVMPLLAERGIAAHFSVSHTTRPIRPSETEGVDYHFVDRSSFDAMVERGEFLEWAEYAGFQYGTARAELEARLSAGEDVFLDIEVQGAAQVKDQVPEEEDRMPPRPSSGAWSGLWVSFRRRRGLSMLLSTTVSSGPWKPCSESVSPNIRDRIVWNCA